MRIPNTHFDIPAKQKINTKCIVGIVWCWLISISMCLYLITIQQPQELSQTSQVSRLMRETPAFETLAHPPKSLSHADIRAYPHIYCTQCLVTHASLPKISRLAGLWPWHLWAPQKKKFQQVGGKLLWTFKQNNHLQR